MSLVISGKAGHWYDASGAARHTILGANGKERAVTLRDARKLNLFPSVTTVMDVMKKGALENWKIEQAIRMALALPRRDGEPEEVFMQRIVDEMERTQEHTRKFGALIHAAVEYLCLNKGELPPATSGLAAELDPVGLWAQHLRNWFHENIVEVIGAEETVVDPSYGYAGRFDLDAIHRVHGHVIIDFKTQGVRDKARFYDEWASQLVAYARRRTLRVDGKAHSIPRCLSVVIDSTKPAAPIEYLWTPEEVEHGWHVFQAALNLWQTVKKYSPQPYLTHLS